MIEKMETFLKKIWSELKICEHAEIPLKLLDVESNISKIIHYSTNCLNTLLYIKARGN